MKPDQTQAHLLPDSELLLRRHAGWVAAWDGGAEGQQVSQNELVEAAFDMYLNGLLPIQVRWRLVKLHPDASARQLGQAQRAAERLLTAAETAPPELRRAQVAAARQKAIQGALAAGEWSAALRGLDRAGEIAGELREASDLGPSDLTLTVSIEEPFNPQMAEEPFNPQVAEEPFNPQVVSG